MDAVVSGCDLASPRPAASPPEPPLPQIPLKGGPTSHLFWQKQLDWQQCPASRCWRWDAASSRGRGVAPHPGGSGWSLQVLLSTDCKPAAGVSHGRADTHTRDAALSGQLPGLAEPASRLCFGGRQPLRLLRRATAGDHGRREAGAVTMGMGEAAGSPAPCGRREWFFPRPSHCRAI